MSLIHDALKKAEQEKKPIDPSLNPAKGSLPNPIISDQTPAPKINRILFILLGISLLFFIYMRFLKKPRTTTTPQPLAAANLFKTSDDLVTLKKSALQLFQKNRFEESLAVWGKLTLLYPTDAEVYNNMGFVLKKMGRKEEAYQAYSKALALKKDYPELLNNFGVLYLNDGQKNQAKKYFKDAIALSEEYADPYFNLAIAFEQEGNTKQAAQNYQQFLKLSPKIEGTLKEKIEKKIDLLAK